LYRQAIEDAEARLERLTQQVTEIVATWSMAPVIAAYQAVRGVAFMTAACGPIAQRNPAISRAIEAPRQGTGRYPRLVCLLGLTERRH